MGTRNRARSRRPAASDLLDVDRAAGSAAHSVPRATVGWLGRFLPPPVGSHIACRRPSPARGVAQQRRDQTSSQVARRGAPHHPRQEVARDHHRDRPPQELPHRRRPATERRGQCHDPARGQPRHRRPAAGLGRSVCPVRVTCGAPPPTTSHTRTVWSSPSLASRGPSGDHATARTPRLPGQGHLRGLCKTTRTVARLLSGWDATDERSSCSGSCSRSASV
jgi:hypothetical protein